MGQNDNQFYQMESKDDNFVDDDIAIHLLVREYYKEHLNTGEYIAYLQRERDCRAYHTGMIQSRKEGYEEGIMLGKEEGILEVKRDCVLMIFKKEFPYEDTHFLENLSIEQYDAIMKLLSENGSLEQIHEVLKK